MNMFISDLDSLQHQQLFCEKFINTVSVPPVNAEGVCGRERRRRERERERERERVSGYGVGDVMRVHGVGERQGNRSYVTNKLVLRYTDVCRQNKHVVSC